MAGGKLIGAFLFFFIILLILQILFPTVEGFDYTLYGVKKGKKTNEKCIFNAECESDICRHFDSPEGPKYTCQ